MQLKSQATLKGLDVSSINGTIDWNAVKADGYSFAYLRAYGSLHNNGGDSQFVTLATNSKAVGMPRGAYIYAVPTLPYNPQEPRDQAQLFIDKMQTGFGTGNFGELIPMIDFEDSTAWGGVPNDYDPGELLLWINEFRNYFESKTGTKLGLYTTYDWVEEHQNNFNYGVAGTAGNIVVDMPLWVAAYESAGHAEVPNFAGWTSYAIWQWEARNIPVAGIVGDVDVDRAVTIPWAIPLKSRGITKQELNTLLLNSVMNSEYHISDKVLHVPTASATNNTTVLKVTDAKVGWGQVDWSEILNKPSSISSGSVDWSVIVNKPTSLVADIDSAVGNAHIQNNDAGTYGTTFALFYESVLGQTGYGIYFGGSTVSGQPYIRYNNITGAETFQFYKAYSTAWSEVKALTFRNSAGTEVSYSGHTHAWSSLTGTPTFLGVNASAGIQTAAGRSYITIKGASDSGVLELTQTLTDQNLSQVGQVQFTDSNSTSVEKRIAGVVATLDGTTANNRGGKLGFYTKIDNGTTGQYLERGFFDSTGRFTVSYGAMFTGGGGSYIGVGTATTPSTSAGVLAFVSNGTAGTDGAYIEYFPPATGNGNTANQLNITGANAGTLSILALKAVKIDMTSGYIQLPASPVTGTSGQINSTGIIKFSNGNNANRIYVESIGVSGSWADNDTNILAGGIYTSAGMKSKGDITMNISAAGGNIGIKFNSFTNLASDFSEIRYYENNTTYAYWGTGNETSALVISSANDGRTANSDVVVLKSTAAVIIDSDGFRLPVLSGADPVTPITGMVWVRSDM